MLCQEKGNSAEMNVNLKRMERSNKWNIVRTQPTDFNKFRFLLSFSDRRVKMQKRGRHGEQSCGGGRDETI